MIVPPVPPDEAARLEALWCYHILDTPQEREFDDIVRLASHLTGMPIALVTLVDEDRQWFKARLGVESPETPREISFCAHAILRPDAPFIVEDPSEDARFCDNPDVVSGLHIRYYAGIPLVNVDGHALGTLCVIDTKPNHLSQEKLDALQALARQVVAQLELRRTARALDEARRAAHEREKAAALHDFTLGVAHEVNNPLMFIGLGAEITMRELASLAAAEPDPARAGRLRALIARQESIRGGVVRLANVSATLSRMTRRARGSERARVLVDGFVREVCAAYEGRVRFEFDLASEVLVDIDAAEMRQVFGALLDNAADAMEGRSGAVRVRSRRVGRVVRVEVADEGAGVPASERARLFTPFYTTKSTGTGCSLALARRIVESNAGRVFLADSEKGAVFCVELRAAA